MVIQKTMQDALNKQVNAELYSGYLYFAMSAYFESLNLKGAARWMYSQAQEEYAHAMRIYNYVNERGGRASLEAIDKPKFEWASPLAAFEEAYSHEQGI